MDRQILFSEAIEGYLLDARARQLSPKTILDYQNSFRHFRNWLDGKDPPLISITADDVREFLTWLGGKVIKPDGVAPRPARKLSKKSILNIHVGLAALWTWAVSEDLAEKHVVRAVKPPVPEKRTIEPFTKEDVEALLEACKFTEAYRRPGKAKCRNRRPTAERDIALVLTLLDTGCRSGELCKSPTSERYARIRDLNRDNLSLRVWGKGAKERIVRISHRTLKAIWRYLLTRPDALDSEPLFASSRGGPLRTDSLYHLINHLGERAGVADAHPHRFRHTFAINFLRNDGKTLELQRLLGHTTLEMVKRYVAIAEVDLERAHRRASPVANWNL